MNDPYLYEDSAVLRNLLNIQDEKALNLAEAELSRANMMLLYEQGFDDFSAEGLCAIHKLLFGDVYAWAGQVRVMNIQKREELLGGKSVWYANDEDILPNLVEAWATVHAIPWDRLSREDFSHQLARTFPHLWKIHPFREGNTRTIVMLMTFFAEHHGYYFDQELLAESAGYVRNAFVLACMGDYAEYEHLEKILLDAICVEPVQYVEYLDNTPEQELSEKYHQYRTADYQPTAHEYRESEQQGCE